MILEGLPQVDAGIVGLGLAGVGFIAGYAELKFKTNSALESVREMKNQKLVDDLKNDKRLEAIEEKHEALDNRVMDKLSNIEKIVANIQGKLDK